jgi:hypothetical protein
MALKKPENFNKTLKKMGFEKGLETKKQRDAFVKELLATTPEQFEEYERNMIKEEGERNI